MENKTAFRPTPRTLLSDKTVRVRPVRYPIGCADDGGRAARLAGKLLRRRRRPSPPLTTGALTQVGTRKLDRHFASTEKIVSGFKGAVNQIIRACYNHSMFRLLLNLIIVLGLWPPTAQIGTPRPLYEFTVQIDYAAQRVAATQRVTLPNTYGQPIKDVLFNVPAANTPGVFDLRSVEVAGVPMTHTLNGTQLRVTLPTVLQPERAIVLDLTFVVNVPPLENAVSFAAANLAYTSDALNLGYWYPLLAPYRDGWVVVPYEPIGDPFASEVADYLATITAPPDVIVVGGGELDRRGNTWRYALPRARTFALIASPRYRESTTRFGSITYSAFMLPEHESLGTITLETMIRAHHLFSALYGPYPYKSLRLAEVSGPWSMEFSGMFTVGATDIGDYNGTPRNRLIRVTAHEVSHQWWYGVVGDDQVREPWLDEGIARFNELRYYEAYSPQNTPWWWASVIGTLRATRPLNASSADFGDHRSYLTSIYNQGAVFLDDLRTTIGVKAFNAFMRDLYRRGSFRLITTQDFFDVLANHTEVNVQGLKSQYFSAVVR